MGRVIMNAAVSLDGFVAYDDDTVGPLFDWYGNGDVPFGYHEEDEGVRVTRPTADFLRDEVSNIGAIVAGRRVFDLTNGWGGKPPAGDHLFVVTHEPPTDWEFADTAPFTFVGSVREAIERAREHSGDRDVSLAAGDVAGQALREGLVDQVGLNLVPVVLGSGRPFFGSGGVLESTIMLENPTRVVEGDRVLHLLYDVRR